MTNEARRFFEEVVKPAFDDWVMGHHESERHARAAAGFVDAMADWTLHNLTPAGFDRPENYRKALAEQSRYFQIVFDVSCGTKHAILVREPRLITRADQIGLGQYEQFDVVPNMDALANVDELSAWFVELDDGSQVLLYEAIKVSIEMWERELTSRGV